MINKPWKLIAYIPTLVKSNYFKKGTDVVQPIWLSDCPEKGHLVLKMHL